MKEKMLNCILVNSEGNFHRKPMYLKYTLYSHLQEKHIQAAVDEVNNEIQKQFKISLNYTLKSSLEDK